MKWKQQTLQAVHCVMYNVLGTRDLYVGDSRNSAEEIILCRAKSVCCPDTLRIAEGKCLTNSQIKCSKVFIQFLMQPCCKFFVQANSIAAL